MARFVHPWMRNLLATFGFMAVACASSAYANTTSYDITGDVTSTLTVIEEARTATDFYDQGGQRFSTNVPFDLQPDTLHVFLYRDATTGDFSLGFVLNAFREGGAGGNLAGTISGLGSNAFVEVADDNSTELAMTFAGSGTAVMNFVWDGRFTDGGIITGLDPENLNFSFNVAASSGLTNIAFISPDGVGGFTADTQSLPNGNASFSFSFSPVAATPEPSTWGLMILGFAAIALQLKHMRRAGKLRKPHWASAPASNYAAIPAT